MSHAEFVPEGKCAVCMGCGYAVQGGGHDGMQPEYMVCGFCEGRGWRTSHVLVHMTADELCDEIEAILDNSSQ